MNSLPIIAKLTDGFVAVADKNGNRLKVIDSAGNSIHSLENRKLELVEQAIKEKKVLSGPSELARDAKIWAIPIGEYALVVTDDGKKNRQIQIENSLKESLSLISSIIGGEASLYNEIGETLHSVNDDGSVNKNAIGQINKDAYTSMSLNKSDVVNSGIIPGGKSILIPISKGLGLELSVLSPQKKMENTLEGNAKYTFENIIGQSPALKKTINISKKAAKSISSVLLLGESGTGKELFAHSIHNHSNRKHKKFVSVNCGAIPENLIESLLFGYEKGTFTGGNTTGKPGLFIDAHNGTVFLDEIGEMDLSLQTRLLRVLQEKEVTPLGGTTTLKVDVRVIAATTKNLEELIEKGKFREDLYYRLHVLPVHIPSLKERKEDISVLVNHFIKEFNILLNKRLSGCSEDALKVLYKYHWPGNVRQLRNCIEWIANMVDTGLIQSTDLPHYLFEDKTKHSTYKEETLEEAIRRFEKEYIAKVLKEVNDNKQEAAKQLGVSATTLWRKINN